MSRTHQILTERISCPPLNKGDGRDLSWVRSAIGGVPVGFEFAGLSISSSQVSTCIGNLLANTNYGGAPGSVTLTLNAPVVQTSYTCLSNDAYVTFVNNSGMEITESTTLPYLEEWVFLLTAEGVQDVSDGNSYRRESPSAPWNFSANPESRGPGSIMGEPARVRHASLNGMTRIPCLEGKSLIYLGSHQIKEPISGSAAPGHRFAEFIFRLYREI